jgi:hypothetical protein
MVSENSGRPSIGLVAVLALAALIGTSALAFTSCADVQAKNKQAFAQGRGGPGGQQDQDPAPGGEHGGPGGPPPDGDNSNPPGPSPDGKGGPGGPGGQQAKEPAKIAATLSVIDRAETESGVDYSATADDSSAIYVGKDGSLNLSKSNIVKSGKASVLPFTIDMITSSALSQCWN